MNILIDTQTPVEQEFTNKIRRQALDDANFELQHFLESTNLSQIKWWYEQAKNNNEDRKKLYM